MAVESYKSNHTDGVSRLFPVDRTGKLRFHRAKIAAANVAAVGDIASTFELGSLPAGRFVVIPSLSYVQCSAWGAARTLSIGHRAYATELGATVAEDAVAFSTALDVSAAAVKQFANAELTFDVFSRAGVDLFGKLAGGTVPIGATLEVLLAYILE